MYHRQTLAQRAHHNRDKEHRHTCQKEHAHLCGASSNVLIPDKSVSVNGFRLGRIVLAVQFQCKFLMQCLGVFIQQIFSAIHCFKFALKLLQLSVKLWVCFSLCSVELLVITSPDPLLHSHSIFMLPQRFRSGHFEHRNQIESVQFFDRNLQIVLCDLFVEIVAQHSNEHIPIVGSRKRLNLRCVISPQSVDQ